MKDKMKSSKLENELMESIDQFIEVEKQIGGNPFLAERIMATIEKQGRTRIVPAYFKAFQMAGMAAGIAIIIFFGITMGAFAGKQFTDRTEIVLLNDAHMEQIEMLVSENKLP